MLDSSIQKILKVTGDLTLHSVTKQVVHDVEGPSAKSKDPWGVIRKGATASTKISRKDFGLVWNKALETGGVTVGDVDNNHPGNRDDQEVTKQK